MVFAGRFLLISFLFVLLGAPITARAEPVSLSSPFVLVSTGGLTTVQFAGSDAGYDSVLYLAGAGDQDPLFINHSTSVGSTANLGTFAAGTELVFRLHVLNTGNDFFTGAGSRNADGFVHARAIAWAGTSRVSTPGVMLGFEDLFGGGDMDFNDFKFVVANARLVDATAAPEPASMLLVGTGIAGVVTRLRRRKKADSSVA